MSQERNDVDASGRQHVWASRLLLRAEILKKIRQFFEQRDYLEVETPLLCSHSVTDPFINSFSIAPTHSSPLTAHSKNQRFLQTSPEYAMKRLLAKGSGPIFQICKAFRVDEPSTKHNPEFTLLEWYRPNFDHHDLMGEMDDFLQTTIDAKPAKKISYADLFIQTLNINPHLADCDALSQCADDHNIQLSNTNNFSKTTCLEILFTHLIEPKLGFDQPAFVYDFPVEQAALAKIRLDDPAVAERFEVYINGTELANGFHELTNAEQQLERFKENNRQRQTLNLPVLPIDPFFIDALKKGLPDCAGVALGVDRLLMLALDKKSITEVISFNWESC